MVSGWTGRSAIVTGAAQGIGAAIAAAGVRAGGDVWLIDIDDEIGRATAAAIGESAHFLHADITDPAAVSAAVATVTAARGVVDILVNNAGRNANFDARQMTVAEWSTVMDLDLRAPWLMTQAVLPGMVEKGHGAIVNLSSLHATLTEEGAFPYAAAKAGLTGLTRSLALDFGPHGIRVNTVSPGWTRSERVAELFATMPADEFAAIEGRHPLRRIAEPAEVAEVVVFLASDATSFVTGANWSVDGGLGARFA